MARRPKLSADGDYVSENGRWVEDPTEASNVVRTLRTHRGSCPLYPERGFDYERLRTIDTTSPRVVEQEARRALAYMVEAGRIWALKVTGRIEGRGVIAVVDFTDGLGQQSLRVPIVRRS